METFTDSRGAESALAAFGLAGRQVLVVGAGQSGDADSTLVGNGRAISLTLAAAGAMVMCADRDLAAAQATAAAIERAGGRATACAADIARPADITALLATTLDRLGRLDGMVLNAGISDRKPLSFITPESWDAIFDVNLRGHMLCAQAALPVMTSGAGIVFISSLAAIRPDGRNPSYEASKAALAALCRAVALEGHGKDIRANVVRAGLVDTPMGRAASAARPGRTAIPMPFGRQGTAWEIARAVLFLLSPAASYINAIELPVDGGLGAGIAR